MIAERQAAEREEKEKEKARKKSMKSKWFVGKDCQRKMITSTLTTTDNNLLDSFQVVYQYTVIRDNTVADRTTGCLQWLYSVNMYVQVVREDCHK